VKAAPLPDTAVTAANPSNAVRKSVLTLFQEYAGVRTPQALTALFAQAASPGSRQEPPVVLSDGVRKVKVTIYMTAAQAPNFSLTGGKMTRLTRESGGYTLEMIPDARVIEATVTMLNQGKTTVIPLTVAPPVDIKTVPTGKFDEAAFAHYLKGGDAAIGDLNGDGMNNYIDDYIFTANYLVRKSTK
jgi:hypothetical protein